MSAKRSVAAILVATSLSAQAQFVTNVANYHDDYRTDAPLSVGWQYLWNAPAGWSPGLTNDGSTGPIGNTSFLQSAK
jgi:hypothetical protein